MESNPLISVVITTYKREIKVLKRAIESVINQSYGNLEIFIVNDYPENVENTEIIRKLITDFNDNRLEYLSYEHNSGACKARNFGIENSHGSYIALLDDDDEWEPNKINSQLRRFQSDKVGLVYCFYNNVSLTGKVEKVIPCDKSGNLFNELLRGNCLGGASMPMIRRDVFDVVGYFDESFKSSQDHDMWLRIAAKYDIACCKEYLVNRYIQNDSISINIEKQKQGFYAFIRKFSSYYSDDKMAYNYLLNQKAKSWYLQGYKNEASQLYKMAVKAKPLSIYNISEPIKGRIKVVINRH